MFVVVLFLICFLVINGFIVLDEETLIILASFVWVDAAGGFIRKALDAELVHKGTVIRDKFFWFLNRKKEIGLELISFYKDRKEYQSNLLLLYNFYSSKLVGELLTHYYVGKAALSQVERELLVSQKNESLPKEVLSKRLNFTVTLFNQSGSDITYASDYSLKGSSLPRLGLSDISIQTA